MSEERSLDNGTRISRREALQKSLYGTSGLLLGGRLANNAYGAVTQPPPAAKVAKAKSVIQVFLWGGMSHIDTWDPKPEAGSEYMGELVKPVATNVDGIQLDGIFPELAKQADKFSLIRSMTHRNNGHETAAAARGAEL